MLTYVNCGKATAGLLADGRHLANRARDEAASYRDWYREPPTLKVRLSIPHEMEDVGLTPHNLSKAVADRLGLYVQAYTLYSSVRPFGISTILGSVDKTGPQLFVVEPSGVFYVRLIYHSTPNPCLTCVASYVTQGYHGAAVGKGRQLAKTELEKLKLSELTTREAVLEAARMYVLCLATMLVCLSLQICSPQHSPCSRRSQGERVRARDVLDWR